VAERAGQVAKLQTERTAMLEELHKSNQALAKIHAEVSSVPEPELMPRIRLTLERLPKPPAPIRNRRLIACLKERIRRCEWCGVPA